VDLLRFACPRCGDEVADRFYGPCPTCRQALVAGQRGEAREQEQTRFEPKMHVVPNHMATKD
jgi:endogenous inhibitor of DNA gyrase (YacG/DUF329 family)